MILLTVAGISAAACDPFEARAKEPVAITTEAIPAAQLGATPMGGYQDRERPRFTVGRLQYAGYGMITRSTDPRFAEIVIDTRPHHPCGYQVEGPSAWNIFDADKSRWSITFRKLASPVEAQPGAKAAGLRGSSPLLEGYVAGPSWPAYARAGKYFIGLMHPQASRNETVIVAFSNKAGPSPAIILARIPLRLDTLAIVPFMHQPLDSIGVAGRQADGAIAQIQLDLTAETEEAVAAELGSTP